MEILKAAFLGIVEGITEWLPISSTGHMILVDEFLKLNVTPAFKELFLVVIQLGAILAVVVHYWQRLLPFDRKGLDREKLNLWGKIIVGTLPAVVFGLLLDDFLNARFYNFQTVAAMLILYGVLFILIENRARGRKPRIARVGEIDYRIALYIGLFQALAIIPGTSRSGATIVGALLLGVSRVAATEFTFYLAIPAMAGASLLKALKLGLPATGAEWAILLVGTAVAFVVSLFVIRFLTAYVKRHDFKAFGWYRIVLGVILLLVFFFVL